MTDLPPPDAPHPDEAVEGTDASDAKRRLVVIAAGLAVVISAIVTIVLMASDDEPNATSRATSTQAGLPSSTSLPSSTANPNATTTTSNTPTSTAPGVTGPRPTDPITKLPLPVPTTATGNTVAATTTTSNNGAPTDAQLDAAYLDAFLAECTKIWSNATNGLLYDPDDPEDTYTITSCTESADAVFRTNGDTIAEAKASGKDDAIWFASLNTSSGQLCWLDTASDTLLGCWDPVNPDAVTTPTTS